MKLKTPCPVCQKDLDLTSETPCGPNATLRAYKCGHSFVEQKHAAPEGSNFRPDDFTSCNGQKQAFEFQIEDIKKIHATNFNVLDANPMGLGKTIEALLAAKSARLEDGTPRFKTILTIVKSATTYQWYAETKEWFDAGLWSVFMIKGSKGFIPPGFRLYILSMDTLSRLMAAKNGGLSTLKSLNIDLVIVDECHSFKNPESARSQALVAFLQDISQTEIQREITLTCNMCARTCNDCGKQFTKPLIDGVCDICAEQNAEDEVLMALSKSDHADKFSGTWTETATIKINLRQQEGTVSYRHQSQCPRCKSRIAVYQDRIVLNETERNKGLIMLSGTPIKNRADEYFVPLNLLRPDVFTSLKRFRSRWLQQDPHTGKYNRIHPYMLDEFRRVTDAFIIRREKNAVLSLPPFRRTFETIYIEDDAIKTAYNKTLADLSKTADKANLNFFDVQENLMTLRRLTGMGKIPFAVEYVDTFLDTTEDEKICIGVHHEAVRDGIYYALQQRGIPCLKLSGEDNAEQKNRIVQKFNNDPATRVLICNMIAGGVGLNLQICNNVLALERQWNAADEEQFECRFNRQGQKLPVLAEYMLAQGTIDTYFSALVEQKRQICGESLDGWAFESDPAALRELIEKTVSHRL